MPGLCAGAPGEHSEGQIGSRVLAGELPNMLNSPVLQELTFPEKKGRYLKIQVVRTVNDEKRVGIAEIGVLTR